MTTTIHNTTYEEYDGMTSRDGKDKGDSGLNRSLERWSNTPLPKVTKHATVEQHYLSVFMKYVSDTLLPVKLKPNLPSAAHA